MMTKKKAILYVALALALGFVGGICAGRVNTATETKVEKVEMPAQKGSIKKPAPVKEAVPENPRLPTVPSILFIDSVEYRYEKVDTGAIIADYEKERHYKELLFDNDNGKLVVDLTTQYNELAGLDYTFTPIATVRTITRRPVLVPLVTASYCTLNYLSIGGGLFHNDVGLLVRYVTNFQKKGFDVGLMYKF